MTFWLSEGIEVLAERIAAGRPPERGDLPNDEFDVLIVGSGYGGAVAAARLAGRRRSKEDGRPIKVAVLERGLEYVPGDFPESVADIPGSIRIDRGGEQIPLGPSDALFRVYANGDAITLVGSALGGGSQINAGVTEEAEPEVFAQQPWPVQIQRDAAHSPRRRFRHFARLARRTLGTTHVGSNEEPAFTKQGAFVSLAEDIKAEYGLAGGVRPARVAIHGPTEPSGPNRFGVNRKPCVACGNCVTGCNHHAKNTLTANYLPLAKLRGASIYTGASVATVTHGKFDHGLFAGGPAWIVEVWPTAADKRPEQRRARDQLLLKAKVVVLAAGAFGSTEILMRSATVDDQRAKKGRECTGDANTSNGADGSVKPPARWKAVGSAPLLSHKLGSRFSGNGDALSFRYYEDAKVDAVAGLPCSHKPGPTITHMLDLRPVLQTPYAKGFADRIVMEDAAVPRALAEIFGEIATSTGLLSQLGRFKTRHEKLEPNLDPLAVSKLALRQTQVLLCMGHDTAAGRLELAPMAGDLAFWKTRPARVQWPTETLDPVYLQQEKLLDLPHRPGVTISNPVATPVPRSISDVLSTPVGGGRVTVHPLGGCPMADNVAEGVVDHMGHVYANREGQRGTEFNEGLFVLDGSIIPTSLGINPLLTITTLAERAIMHIRKRYGWKGDAIMHRRALPKAPTLPERPAGPKLWPDVSVRMSERLRLPMKGGALPAPWAAMFCNEQENELRRTPNENVAVALDLDYPVDSIYAFLEDNHDVRKDTRKVVLDLDSSRLRLLTEQKSLRPGTRWRDKRTAIRFTRGELVFLHIKPAWALVRIFRGIREWWAIRGCIEVRRELKAMWGKVRRWLARRRIAVRRRRAAASPGDPRRGALERPDTQSLAAQLLQAWTMFRSLPRLAYHAGEVRTFEYELEWKDAKGIEYLLRGRKTITLKRDINPWSSLFELRCELFDKTHGQRVPGEFTFSLDLVDLLRNRLPKVTAADDSVSSVLANVSFVAFMARLMLHTYLWRFQAPDYPDDDEIPPRHRASGPLEGCVGPDFHVVETRWFGGPQEKDKRSSRRPKVPLLLTRYQPGRTIARRKFPVILFPGFAASTLQFSTDGVRVDEHSPCRNLVQTLCAAGFDVWLADVRTSSGLPSGEQQWDFDAVAVNDVPDIIKRVLAETGAGEVHLFGHCMGGANISMAVTRSNCRLDLTRIRSYIFSQVSPFVVPHGNTALRAEVAGLLRQTLGNTVLHPTVDRPPTAAEALFDRFAWSYPVDADAFYEFTLHERPEVATIKRLQAMLGVMWPRKNVSTFMEQNFQHTYGPGNVRTFWQIMNMAHSGRVVDNVARNEYSGDEGLTRAFSRARVLFLHGRESKMFDPIGSVLMWKHLRNLIPAGRDGPRRFWLRRIRGYGHFDPIIGTKAHEHVYPHFVDFLINAEQKELPDPEHPSYEWHLRAPRTGPILGWTRNDESGRRSRLWIELDASDTAKPRGALFLRLDPAVFARKFAADGPIDWGDEDILGAIDAGWFAPPVSEPFNRMTTIGVACVDIEDPSRDTPFLCLGVYRRLKPYHPARKPATRRDGSPTDGPRGAALRLDAEPQEIDKWMESLKRRIVTAAVDPTAEAFCLPADDYAENVEPERDKHGPPRTDEHAKESLYPQRLTAEQLVQVRLALASSRCADSDLKSADTVAQAIAIVPADPADDARNDSLVFTIASCSSPGSPFDAGLADTGFRSLRQTVEQQRPSFALFLGDQIYADDNADLLDASTTIERVYERYRRAFSLSNARQVLRSVPVYMAPDDHETFDNYNGRERLDERDTGIASGTAGSRLSDVTNRLGYAECAYVAYQQSHSPRFDYRRGKHQEHWYEFEHRGWPVFVMDSRFDREWERERFVSDRQWTALRQFLRKHPKDAPKIVASGSVLLPMLTDTATSDPASRVRDDSWWRYPAKIAKLFRLIRREGIDNIVFVAGDIHCSLAAEITIELSKDRCLKAWSIASSGLYAPYRFANTTPNQYVQHSNAIPKTSWVFRMLGPGVSWAKIKEKEPMSVNGHAVVRLSMDRKRQLSVDVDFVSSRDPAASGRTANDVRGAVAPSTPNTTRAGEPSPARTTETHAMQKDRLPTTERH